MLGVHRQRHALRRGHGVPAVPRGPEDGQHRGDGADGAADHEVLPHARQHEGLSRAVGRGAMSTAALELHQRQ